jgi:glycosyltransferase involved in cell wall biosynthesis
MNQTKNRETQPVQAAVIIPTYNNSNTVAEVIDSVKRYCSDIIVVNDGSTDETAEILSRIQDIVTVNFPVNKGKGFALIAGFEKALEYSFTHAITIDSDGQHVPEDIALLLEKVKTDPDAIWIGNRILPCTASAGQPGRSSFGRRFSNFWFRFSTGIRLHDTQCGFRAYPLQQTLILQCKGGRYEYEQDVLIKAAWRGIPVKEVNVTLYYLPEEKRVSHFRPFRDFVRIGRINSQAAMIRIFLPHDMLELPGGTWVEKIRILIRHELKAHSSPHKASFSLAAGVFLALFPIHGIQIITLMAISPFLKLNRPLAFLGLCVSTPPVLPFIIWAAIELGSQVLPAHFPFLSMLDTVIVRGIIEFTVGSIILSFGMGILAYFVSYPFFKHVVKGKFFAGKKEP